MTRDVEPVEVRTSDGGSLAVEIRAPAGALPARGVAVLVHGLLSRRRDFDRPTGAGIASWLADRGWSVVAFDRRGHGGSAASGGRAAGYDALVEVDLPAICELARWQAGADAPVVVLGHGVGGHAALASVAVGAADADAVVTLAAAVPIAALDPSPARRWAWRSVGPGAAERVERAAASPRWASAIVRTIPARAIADRVRGASSDALLARDVARFARSGRWTSERGDRDYLASIGALAVPSLHVASEGDRVVCPPACARALADACGSRTDVLLAPSRAPSPTMARARAPVRSLVATAGAPVRSLVATAGAPVRSLVATDLLRGARSRETWARIESWMRARAIARSPQLVIADE